MGNLLAVSHAQLSEKKRGERKKKGKPCQASPPVVISRSFNIVTLEMGEEKKKGKKEGEKKGGEGTAAGCARLAIRWRRACTMPSLNWRGKKKEKKGGGEGKSAGQANRRASRARAAPSNVSCRARTKKRRKEKRGKRIKDGAEVAGARRQRRRGLTWIRVRDDAGAEKKKKKGKKGRGEEKKKKKGRERKKRVPDERKIARVVMGPPLRLRRLHAEKKEKERGGRGKSTGAVVDAHVSIVLDPSTMYRYILCGGASAHEGQDVERGEKKKRRKKGKEGGAAADHDHLSPVVSGLVFQVQWRQKKKKKKKKKREREKKRRGNSTTPLSTIRSACGSKKEKEGGREEGHRRTPVRNGDTGHQFLWALSFALRMSSAREKERKKKGKEGRSCPPGRHLRCARLGGRRGPRIREEREKKKRKRKKDDEIVAPRRDYRVSKKKKKGGGKREGDGEKDHDVVVLVGHV